MRQKIEKYYDIIKQLIEDISWDNEEVNRKNIIFREVPMLVSNLSVTSLYYIHISHNTYI